MKLAGHNIDIPKYWEHDPLLTDEGGHTVAVYLAHKGKDVPK